MRLLLALLLLGCSDMAEPAPAAVPAASVRSARPMQGPDFVFAPVAAVERGALVLADGSRWTLPAGSDDAAEAFRGAQQRGVPVFVSGDRAAGRMERFAFPTRSAAETVNAHPEDGRLGVALAGPPSVYHLRTDRPWYAQAAALLRRSAATANLAQPDLWVTRDIQTNEIVDVRPLN